MPAENTDTEAIVLDCFDHGESDKIVTLFTRDHGRLIGIAKGAKKSKKRFLNKLELFSHITLTFSERSRSSLIFLNDADLRDGFLQLRLRMDRYIAATFIRELLLLATAEKERDQPLFDLLHWTLTSIDVGRDCRDISIIFLVRLFARLGYQPGLYHCHRCAQPLLNGQHYLFHLGGALLCSRCLAGDTANGTPLSIGTIRMLQTCLEEPLERLHRLHFSRQARSQGLLMLYRYGRTLLQRDIHSWKAMRGLIELQTAPGSTS